MSRFSTTWIQVYAHDESKEQKQVPAVGGGGVVLLSLSPHVHTHTNTHKPPLFIHRLAGVVPNSSPELQ